ncbi:hypothetical protein TIFTF001_031972 [Ficus carica]|uniref:Pentatricopeptide repeat-containing protein n=1 Tax=Ficus carica TaxID=3494 RepID=A0AA88E2J1_FICCA|nr:hypothetical protein TIFTF001_031972 [Ficus carica]
MHTAVQHFPVRQPKHLLPLAVHRFPYRNTDFLLLQSSSSAETEREYGAKPKELQFPVPKSQTMKTQIPTSKTPGIPSIFSLFRILTTTHFRSYAFTNSTDCITRFEKMVHTRCKSGNLTVTEALGFFSSMIGMRPLPSVLVFNHLLGTLSKMNQYSTVVSMYREMIGSVYFRPNVGTLSIVIRCFFCLEDRKLGFSVFATMIKSGLRPNAYTLSTLLHGLCKEGSMVAAMKLFREIVGKEHLCNEITYATVINGFCKARETRKALEVLKQMYNDERVKPDVHCFSPIIDSFCKERRIDEAVNVFEEMINCGVLPNVISYSCLVHGLCILDRWEEANKLLINMLDFGISPDVCTYNVLIDSVCKKGEPRAALSLFGLMIRKGIEPTIVTFNSLISSSYKYGQWKEAARFIDNMALYGISPDVVTFNTMLDARSKEGSTTEAVFLVEAMLDKGLLPDPVTYASLTCRLCQSFKLEEAERLFDGMASWNIFPRIRTLNIILNALSTEGMMEKARALFEAMLDYGKEVDTITYNTLIKGYCRQGEMDKAKDVFDRMAIEGALPDTISYNTLASGYTNVNRIDLALKLLKDMIRKGLVPNHCYLFIYGFCVGRLTLTNYALYFELLGVGLYEEAVRYDLATDMKQVIRPGLTGPLDACIGCLADPVYLEFPEFKGNSCRDYWLDSFLEMLTGLSGKTTSEKLKHQNFTSGTLPTQVHIRKEASLHDEAIIDGDICAGKTNPLELALKQWESNTDSAEAAQATVDRMKVDGIDTNIAVMKVRWKCLVLTLMWFIWMERNARILED